MTDVNSLLQVIERYGGSTWFLVLFLAAIVYLLARSERKTRRNIILAILAAILIIFNEGSFHVAGRIAETETYYRFLWMIPVIPVLAYVAVDLIIMKKKMVYRILAAAAVLVTVFLAGDAYLSRESFKPLPEVHYVSEEVQEICNVISEDKTEEHPKVACEFQVALELRLADPSLRAGIVRHTYLFDESKRPKSRFRKRQLHLLHLVDGQEMEPERIARVLEKNKTDYVVIANAYQADGRMEAAGCSIVGKSANYTVYRA